jgi:hypothetical protein
VCYYNWQVVNYNSQVQTIVNNKLEGKPNGEHPWVIDDCTIVCEINVRASSRFCALVRFLAFLWATSVAYNVQSAKARCRLQTSSP